MELGTQGSWALYRCWVQVGDRHRPGPASLARRRRGGFSSDRRRPRGTPVALTGGSSKQFLLFRRLAAALPSLLKGRAGPISIRRRQVQRRLTLEQAEQLVSEYQAGASMKDLAARWRLHRTTVASQLRLAGVVIRRQGVPGDRLDEAIRLYGDGWSLQRLAARYRCDDETVRQALKRAGLPLRRPWQR
jgi:hypothetical protein